MKIRTYTELIKLPTFKERYEYLRIGGTVGHETFGKERWLNQKFYTSTEWRNFRREIIIRDRGFDLACSERPFEPGEKIYIHHMNPIELEDVTNLSDVLMDPELVVCTSFVTHQAIHFGDISLLGLEEPIERTLYDTCPWRL